MVVFACIILILMKIIFQLWEKNASSSLSLFAYIDQLMKMDAQWRKTEIKCWDTLLNDTLKNITIDHSMYIRVYHLILNSVEGIFLLSFGNHCIFFASKNLLLLICIFLRRVLY